MKKLMVMASLAMILLAPAIYADNIISAADPEAILNIAKGYGSATLGTDSVNDPMITGMINGTRYGIIFEGCSNNKDCDDIRFVSSWSGVQVSLAELNTWNKDKKYGRTYLDDDGDPWLEMQVNLNYGVTQKNLDDTFQWWTRSLAEYISQVLKQ